MIKVVTLEEHIGDVDINKALSRYPRKENAYMAGWGSKFIDDPYSYDDNRPHLASGREAAEFLFEVGARRIALMDLHGIDMQVLSYPYEIQFLPADVAASLTRNANDQLAGFISANPARFAGFATLPWQDSKLAVEELDRAVTELGLRGALLVGRPGEGFIGDTRYAPILRKAAALKVPLYLHPGTTIPIVREHYYGGFDNEIGARIALFGWGWHNEGGVQAIRLILSGAFEREPDLQIISGHWGEMVPFFLQRLDDTLPMAVTGLSRTISETYRSHFYVTPSGMLSKPHFEFINKIVGTDRIMYAIDYPYLSLTGAREFIEELSVDFEGIEKVSSENAKYLLKLQV